VWSPPLFPLLQLSHVPRQLFCGLRARDSLLWCWRKGQPYLHSAVPFTFVNSYCGVRQNDSRVQLIFGPNAGASGGPQMRFSQVVCNDIEQEHTDAARLFGCGLSLDRSEVWCWRQWSETPRLLLRAQFSPVQLRFTHMSLDPGDGNNKARVCGVDEWLLLLCADENGAEVIRAPGTLRVAATSYSVLRIAAADLAVQKFKAADSSWVPLGVTAFVPSGRFLVAANGGNDAACALNSTLPCATLAGALAALQYPGSTITLLPGMHVVSAPLTVRFTATVLEGLGRGVLIDCSAVREQPCLTVHLYTREFAVSGVIFFGAGSAALDLGPGLTTISDCSFQGGRRDAIVQHNEPTRLLVRRTTFTGNKETCIKVRACQLIVSDCSFEGSVGIVMDAQSMPVCPECVCSCCYCSLTLFFVCSRRR
jgi:hypothetical protein